MLVDEISVRHFRDRNAAMQCSFYAIVEFKMLVCGEKYIDFKRARVAGSG
jgi:hypothetical protein